MAKKSSNTNKILIKVLWGDAEIGEVSRKFDGIGGMQIGRGLFSDIRSPVWPLRDDLTLFEKEGGRLFLNPDVPWNGLIATGSDVCVLDSRSRNRINLEIRPGCYATLRFEDITVAIRVGADHKEFKQKQIMAGKYRGPLLGLIADTPYEQAALSVAILASLLVVGAIAGGLSQRTVWRPERQADLADSVRLPFISPLHFSTAPEVIQDRLDRFHLVNSVTGYYTDLAEVMTRPDDAGKQSSIFSETINSYKRSLAAQKETLAQMNAATARTARDLKTRGSFVLSMPVVQGESLDGSMQRILDKIAFVSATAKGLTETRAKTGDTFRGDASYDYGSAGGQSGKDELADFTKRLGDGFRKALPDEEQQALEAKTLAVEASALQVSLFGKEHLRAGVRDCCDTVVGVKAGATPITYSPMPRFGESDEKLAALRASTWGAPDEKTKDPKIVEPIAGIIDSKQVEKAIASGRFQLQLCFELALRRNQAAKGSMEWTWRIDTRGQISGLALTNSTLKDEELVQCVRKRIAGWRFPKPKGGSVEIRYPFEFVRDRG